ncbi:hypothetical protein [Mycobacterium phage Weirdo19]|uniref:Uncharacterized protein n=1 Tax=Mycobacterium phage Weirdo19 TaxID=2601610 RepID=A0A6M2YSV6_9CAUD|nr:hypothetical protein KDJ11_gp87 [Mycobacterium phage Weirdo19]QEA10855.1 hypothetical protein [Mycobacterium phage Weirdo19]
MTLGIRVQRITAYLLAYVTLAAAVGITLDVLLADLPASWLLAAIPLGWIAYHLLDALAMTRPPRRPR